MSDLIERLRYAAARKWPEPDVARHSLFSDAADTIARLTAERDAARREAMEECARLLDAEHEQRKQWDNHAAYYANMIRAAMQGEGK
ncbi:MAG: hypothetical protein ACK5QX_05310 [bacterium]|jgi:hypothetical protein